MPKQNKQAKGFKKNQKQNIVVNVKTKELSKKEEDTIVNRVMQAMEENKIGGKTFDTPVQDNKRVDASLKRMSELEDRLNAMMMEAEAREKPVEVNPAFIESTVYTNAWDLKPFAQYALVMVEAINRVRSNPSPLEAIEFILWVCSVAEEYTMAQDELIGHFGITRDDVVEARENLQNLEIPEHLMFMLLQLRPKVLDNGTKFVFIPHDIDVGGVQHVAAGAIQHNNNTYNITMHRAGLWVKPVAGVLQARVAVPHVLRMNVGPLIDAYANTANANPVDPLIVSDTVGLPYDYYAMKGQYLSRIIRHQQQFNAPRYVWKAFLNFGVDKHYCKHLGNTYFGFGTRKDVASCFRKDIPIAIDDVVNRRYTAIAASTMADMWVPVIRTDTIAHAGALVEAVRASHASMHRTIINQVQVNDVAGNISYRIWKNNLSFLTDGNSTHMRSTFLGHG